MIWLCLRGLTAALFEYDPRTVRRWINRYNDLGSPAWKTIPVLARLALAALGSASASG